ncbi:unnamed protein product [Amoebophrya sp. A25]|nr:unnamed protein product [Amoebophrya sp. A25]|eukprot:GSA25T00011286001.1
MTSYGATIHNHFGAENAGPHLPMGSDTEDEQVEDHSNAFLEHHQRAMGHDPNYTFAATVFSGAFAMEESAGGTASNDINAHGGGSSSRSQGSRKSGGIGGKRAGGRKRKKSSTSRRIDELQPENFSQFEQPWMNQSGGASLSSHSRSAIVSRTSTTGSRSLQASQDKVPQDTARFMLSSEATGTTHAEVVSGVRNFPQKPFEKWSEGDRFLLGLVLILTVCLVDVGTSEVQRAVVRVLGGSHTHTLAFVVLTNLALLIFWPIHFVRTAYKNYANPDEPDEEETASAAIRASGLAFFRGKMYDTLSGALIEQPDERAGRRRRRDEIRDATWSRDPTRTVMVQKNRGKIPPRDVAKLRVQGDGEMTDPTPRMNEYYESDINFAGAAEQYERRLMQENGLLQLKDTNTFLSASVSSSGQGGERSMRNSVSEHETGDSSSQRRQEARRWHRKNGQEHQPGDSVVVNMDRRSGTEGDQSIATSEILQDQQALYRDPEANSSFATLESYRGGKRTPQQISFSRSNNLVIADHQQGGQWQVPPPGAGASRNIRGASGTKERPRVPSLSMSPAARVRGRVSPGPKFLQSPSEVDMARIGGTSINWQRHPTSTGRSSRILLGSVTLATTRPSVEEVQSPVGLIHSSSPLDERYSVPPHTTAQVPSVAAEVEDVELKPSTPPPAAASESSRSTLSERAAAEDARPTDATPSSKKLGGTGETESPPLKLLSNLPRSQHSSCSSSSSSSHFFALPRASQGMPTAQPQNFLTPPEVSPVATARDVAHGNGDESETNAHARDGPSASKSFDRRLYEGSHRMEKKVEDEASAHEDDLMPLRPINIISKLEVSHEQREEGGEEEQNQTYRVIVTTSEGEEQARLDNMLQEVSLGSARSVDHMHMESSSFHQSQLLSVNRERSGRAWPRASPYRKSTKRHRKRREGTANAAGANSSSQLLDSIKESEIGSPHEDDGGNHNRDSGHSHIEASNTRYATNWALVDGPAMEDDSFTYGKSPRADEDESSVDTSDSDRYFLGSRANPESFSLGSEDHRPKRKSTKRLRFDDRVSFAPETINSTRNSKRIARTSRRRPDQLLQAVLDNESSMASTSSSGPRQSTEYATEEEIVYEFDDDQESVRSAERQEREDEETRETLLPPSVREPRGFVSHSRVHKKPSKKDISGASMYLFAPDYEAPARKQEEEDRRDINASEVTEEYATAGQPLQNQTLDSNEDKNGEDRSENAAAVPSESAPTNIGNYKSGESETRSAEKKKRAGNKRRRESKKDTEQRGSLFDDARKNQIPDEEAVASFVQPQRDNTDADGGQTRAKSLRDHLHVASFLLAGRRMSLTRQPLPEETTKGNSSMPLDKKTKSRKSRRSVDKDKKGRRAQQEDEDQEPNEDLLAEPVAAYDADRDGHGAPPDEVIDCQDRTSTRSKEEDQDGPGFVKLPGNGSRRVFQPIQHNRRETRENLQLGSIRPKPKSPGSSSSSATSETKRKTLPKSSPSHQNLQAGDEVGALGQSSLQLNSSSGRQEGVSTLLDLFTVQDRDFFTGAPMTASRARAKSEALYGFTRLTRLSSKMKNAARLQQGTTEEGSRAASQAWSDASMTSTVSSTRSLIDRIAASTARPPVYVIIALIAPVYLLAQWTALQGMTHSSLSNCALVSSFTGVSVYLLSVMWIGEEHDGSKWLGVLLSACGVFVVLHSGGEATDAAASARQASGSSQNDVDGSYETTTTNMFPGASSGITFFLKDMLQLHTRTSTLDDAKRAFLDSEYSVLRPHKLALGVSFNSEDTTEQMSLLVSQQDPDPSSSTTDSPDSSSSLAGETTSMAGQNQKVHITAPWSSGVVYSLLASVVFAAYAILVTEYIRDPVIFLAYIGLYTLCVGVPLVLLCDYGVLHELMQVGAEQYGGTLALLGIANAFMGQFCYAWGLLLTSPTVAVLGLACSIPLSILFERVLCVNCAPLFGYHVAAGLCILAGFGAFLYGHLQGKRRISHAFTR